MLIKAHIEIATAVRMPAAFKEGAKAKVKGRRLRDNPYNDDHNADEKELERFVHWEEGWRSVAKERAAADPPAVPAPVRKAAQRGLALRKQHGRGGTAIGVARARDLMHGKTSWSSIKRMKAYFDRHAVDKNGEGWGKDSAGYIAWLLWGGDAGRSWANKQMRSR